MSRPTQNQIAFKADVDRSSVSKILSGRQIELFDPVTVKRVKDAAMELGYRHWGHAREIWCVFPLPNGDKIYDASYRFLETMMGINNALKGVNCSFHLVRLDENFSFARSQADGCLVWENMSERFFKDLVKLDIPHIVLNRIPQNYHGSYVIHDDNIDFNLAMEYLLKANHKNIAFISNQKINEINEYFNDIVNFLQENNLQFFYLSNSNHNEMIEFLENKKITGIIAINDITGKQTVDLIRQAGGKIPEDYSIIVNNYTELNHSVTLKITGIKTPWQEIAYKGTELLLSMIAGKSTGRKPVCKVIAPKVTKGDSVKSI